MSILDTKNVTPRALSFFTALIVSVVNALLSILLHPIWYAPLLVFIVTFALVYSVYYYTLQRFIYRKIKLIYKFIYQTKATKKEEIFYKYLLPKKGIDEVREDVEQWAEKQ